MAQVPRKAIGFVTGADIEVNKLDEGGGLKESAQPKAATAPAKKAPAKKADDK